MNSTHYCSVCEERVGYSFCRGCQAFFCDTDFQRHVGTLLHELDGLAADRNDLKVKVNNITSSKQFGKIILKQIDEWQEKTIESVKQAAELARQQFFRIMTIKREEITKRFQTLSKELQKLHDTKNVVEQDLSRLKHNISQLDDDFEKITQLAIVGLNTKQSERINWNQMIYIEEKLVKASNSTTDAIQEQQFDMDNVQQRLPCDGHICFKCYGHSVSTIALYRMVVPSFSIRVQTNK